MRRAAAWLAVAGSAAAALAGGGLAAAPAGACACGIAIEASVSEETALIVERPGEEEIVLSLDLASDGTERPAVVVPVPGVPEVVAVRGPDPLAYLETATMPPPEVGATGGSDDAATVPSGVDVLDEQVIGGYQVARLESGDAAALRRWLDRNGYALPAGAEPILAEYVEEGWRFVAIRLAPEATGRLKPLSITFDTGEYVYPMRLAQLGTEPIDVTLFTLAGGPRSAQGLARSWAGEVTELSPPPHPPSVARLVDDGTYLTRLEGTALDPGAFTEDILIEPDAFPAADQISIEVPDAAVEPEDEGISAGTVIALICAGLAFALGLAVATRR
jgi:hypothetical protein